MKKILNDKLFSIIFAALVIVVGIGFCISKAAGVDIVTWITGLVIIAYGVINIIGAVSDKKSLAVRQAIIGVALLVFGIFYIKYELVEYIVAFAPWLVAGVGVALIIDCVLAKTIRKVKDNKPVIIQLIIGVVSLVVALLILLVPEIWKLSYIILGVILIAFGVYSIVKIALNKK